MKVLVTGGCATDLVDADLCVKARAVWIDLMFGYIRKADRRFMLYHAEAYPYADQKRGYALRSRVVWWLATGEAVKGCLGFNLHHRNHVRSDDRLENLQKIDHVAHARLHNPIRTLKELTCEGCGRSYRLPAWRIRQREKEGHPARFCSLTCRSSVPMSEKARLSRSIGLKAAYAEGRR